LNPHYKKLELRFHKYHGTGNDFILIDGREPYFDTNSGLIAKLCDRRFGIGADGLIVLEKVKEFDFRMIYFNSDGKESTMCGNGGRCIMAFADFLSLIGEEARFMAIDGAHVGKIIGHAGTTYQVKIRMNDVKAINSRGDDFVIDTGSPHFIRFSKNIHDFDVPGLARPIRYHHDFEPDGINVNFVEESGHYLFVRSYERGVEDETLSCGTGVTASALAFAHRTGMLDGTIPIRTLGGELLVSFTRMDDGSYTDIWLEGPAVRVFEGMVNI
jgi:diaminopimelate epimerase